MVNHCFLVSCTSIHGLTMAIYCLLVTMVKGCFPCLKHMYPWSKYHYILFYGNHCHPTAFLSQAYLFMNLLFYGNHGQPLFFLSQAHLSMV